MKRALFGLWHRSLRFTGRSGMVGATLVVAAALIATSLPHFRHTGRMLRLEVATRSSRIPVPISASELHPPRVDDKVGNFVATFPPLSQSPSDLEEVFSSAKRRNIRLLRAEYQFKHEPKAPLVTYTVTFPLRSDYGSIRNFTADVLRVLPHASLDELRMNRSASGSNVLDSVIRFTFVYRRT